MNVGYKIEKRIKEKEKRKKGKKEKEKKKIGENWGKKDCDSCWLGYRILFLLN